MQEYDLQQIHKMLLPKEKNTEPNKFIFSYKKPVIHQMYSGTADTMET